LIVFNVGGVEVLLVGSYIIINIYNVDGGLVFIKFFSIIGLFNEIFVYIYDVLGNFDMMGGYGVYVFDI